MKVGLIARAEDRGLGVISWAFQRHIRPERTLLIRPTAQIARGFEQHADRFPGATQAEWGGGDLDEGLVRGWLDGLDVVYSAETWYDHRIVGWAKDAGVATALHVMPELWSPDWPTSTETWLPTTWRAEVFGPDARLVPVPLEGHQTRAPHDGPLRVLHVAGHRAMADRNGTIPFLQALRSVRSPMEATLLCQDRRGPIPNGLPRNVVYRAVLGPQPSLAPFYAEADVVVLPRRYGGLCLPALEAFAAGCVVMMPAVPPNEDWPIVGIPAVLSEAHAIRTAAGEIPVAIGAPTAYAATLDALANDRAWLAVRQKQVAEWALTNTWDALLPCWLSALENAAATP